MSRVFSVGFYTVLFALVPLYGMTFNWSIDFDEALKTAQKEDKPIVVYCYHPRTVKEDKKVWLHPLVQKFSNDFIGVNINMMTIDQESGFAKKHQVNILPAVLFFESQGNELISFRYEEEELKRTFLAVRLRKVLDAVEEYELVKSQVKNANSKDPRIIYLYAKGLRDRGHFDESEELFNHLMRQKDIPENLMLQIKEGYINMFFLKASRAFYDGEYDQSIGTMQQFLKRYPGDEAVHRANFLLGISMYESGARKDGEKILKKLAKNSSAGIMQHKAERYLSEKKR